MVTLCSCGMGEIGACPCVRLLVKHLEAETLSERDKPRRRRKVYKPECCEASILGTCSYHVRTQRAFAWNEVRVFETQMDLAEVLLKKRVSNRWELEGACDSTLAHTRRPALT